MKTKLTVLMTSAFIAFFAGFAAMTLQPTTAYAADPDPMYGNPQLT